jgi:hypothetical protein
MALTHPLLLAASRTVGRPLPTVVPRSVTRNGREPDKQDGNRWLRGVLEEEAFEGFLVLGHEIGVLTAGGFWQE